MASGGFVNNFPIYLGEHFIDVKPDWQVGEETWDSLREKRKGSKPISSPFGTSEISHSATLLMDTTEHHTWQTAVRLFEKMMQKVENIAAILKPTFGFIKEYKIKWAQIMLIRKYSFYQRNDTL